MLVDVSAGNSRAVDRVMCVGSRRHGMSATIAGTAEFPLPPLAFNFSAIAEI